MPRDAFFLPNFCDIRMVFAVIVIGELLAFVLTLAPFAPGGERWSQLSVISLFVQWVGLTSAAVLCYTRAQLGRLRENTAATISYVLLLLVTLVLSEIAYRIALLTGYGWEVTPYWHVELLLRNLAISAVVNAVTLRYFYVQHQWEQQVKAESLARIAALQARIRPHFLFNSLNTIASLTRSDPVLAEEAVIDLADLFRHSLADPGQQVALTKEIELSRRYLRIEQLRLGERLRVEWDIAALPEDALLPPLSVQPLLENAVYHGIEPRTDGGTIRVRGQRDGDQLTLSIDNPVPEHNINQRQGNKMALDNIRLRFEALHGKRSRLHTEQNAHGFLVELHFPYLTKPA
ncbi:MAG: histidine kinase [Gammaproteobacteria bacterium]|nr:histidine kinase [Gammaproteobacteria bacterium]